MTTTVLKQMSERYLSVLRKYLQSGSSGTADSQLARRLGLYAKRVGVGTLQLAQIHESALKKISSSSKHVTLANKARRFFDEVNLLLLKTPLAVRREQTALAKLNRELVRRTTDLTLANRHLHNGMCRRKTAEKALKVSGIHYSKLLRESLQLQAALRKLTHRIFEAQENERKKISLKLQDEVSQTLVGINVRLLNYKGEFFLNRKGLKNEISITQRLVAKTANSLRSMSNKLQRK